MAVSWLSSVCKYVLNNHYHLFVFKGGTDYVTLTDEVLLFEPDSSNQQCVNVSTIADTAVEGDETFSVVLSTNDPDVSVNLPATTVLIADNDSKFVIFDCINYLSFRRCSSPHTSTILAMCQVDTSWSKTICGPNVASKSIAKYNNIKFNNTPNLCTN